MKLLGLDKVFCLSPHPDDVELAMLGTIKKYTGTKFDVICLCQGSDHDPSTSENRLQEVKDVWKQANCPNVELLFSGTKYIKDYGPDDWITYLEKTYINEGKYDAIFLPNEDDSHWEHRIISNLGPALIRASKISLIQYYTPSTQDDWDPNFYVDITTVYDSKLEALTLFGSQAHRYYFKKKVLNSFHSDFQCCKKGMDWVEKFKILNFFEG